MAAARDRLDWFPFFTKDFMDGTSTMSNAEVGAYTRMLAHSWGNGPLPRDEVKLARIVHVGVAGLRKLWETVGEKWRPTPAGWVNDKLEQVRAKQLDVIAGRSKAGEAGAAARWNDGKRIANASQSQCGRNGKTMPSENLELRTQNDLPEDREIVPPTPRKRGGLAAAGYPPDFLAFWRTYPRHESKVTAFKAWQSIAPSLDLRTQIAEALVWQMQQPKWLERNGAFVPYAATWLNGRRWEDEPFHPAIDDESAAWARVASGQGKLV